MNIGFGIGFLIAGLLVVAGIIVLVISIIRTAKKKKTLGGIIAGSLMAFIGTIILCVFCFAFSMAGVLSGF